MTDQTKRAGFGEPLTFEGSDADVIRNLLETGDVYPERIGDYFLYKRLLHTAVPTLEVCVNVRRAIQESSDVLLGIETVPDVESPDRDGFELSMDKVFDSAREAFKNRPPSCEMVDRGDDWFDCNRCDFERVLDVNS